jgi:hypothetical protein
MRAVLGLLVLIVATAGSGSPAAGSRQIDPQHELLSRMIGHWVMRGTISGQATTHDVDARSMLNEEYVEIQEVSRERDASGKPQYEAMIYLVWNPKVGEYACLWLDTTDVTSFAPEGIGHAKPARDQISLVFTDQDGGIHTTFSYDRSLDRWQWSIDNVLKGALKPFARLTLTRQ